ISPNKPQHGSDYAADRSHPGNPVTWDEETRSWNFSANADGKGSPIRLYATGMRDMNVPDSKVLPSNLKETTWPAYSMITYICSSTIDEGSLQANIFFLDNRDLQAFIRCASCCSSNNSYGFTVWPVKDE
ncbi:MAG: hypothetical protein K2L58_03025, partial [Duncaniella sp.]|nr:hypothetical protein [Duncaniella sp.]